MTSPIRKPWWQLAAERDIKLAVGQQMRYFRHYQTVAEFVRFRRSWARSSKSIFFNAKPRHPSAQPGRL